MHLGLSRIYASVFPQAIHHSLSSEATSHVSLLSTDPLRGTVVTVPQIRAIYYTNRVARPRWPLYFIIHSVIQRLVPLFLCPLLQFADNSQIWLSIGNQYRCNLALRQGNVCVRTSIPLACASFGWSPIGDDWKWCTCDTN